ncbi:hypothetical protein GJAV_G00107150 [Gymnothorax javanicus]|nr:hypothetical protein GJAV_G00107150 [Gymnothorax javanicus]
MPQNHRVLRTDVGDYICKRCSPFLELIEAVVLTKARLVSDDSLGIGTPLCLCCRNTLLFCLCDFVPVFMLGLHEDSL